MNLPKHVAIIMDGNGRWAQDRGLLRYKGHIEGASTAKKIIFAAKDMGIEVLTLFSFSTENWKRPSDEVDFILKLPIKYINENFQSILNNNIRINFLGELESLPFKTKKTFLHIKEKTKKNTGLLVNIAFNYGSRREIVFMCKKIAQKVKEGALFLDEIDEELISSNLFTKGLKDPDLLIRTGKEFRLSNFLLWQLAYTELYFSSVLWPDFTEADFKKAILDYMGRKRRFGGLQN